MTKLELILGKGYIKMIKNQDQVNQKSEKNKNKNKKATWLRPQYNTLLKCKTIFKLKVVVEEFLTDQWKIKEKDSKCGIETTTDNNGLYNMWNTVYVCVYVQYVSITLMSLYCLY